MQPFPTQNLEHEREKHARIPFNPLKSILSFTHSGAITPISPLLEQLQEELHFDFLSFFQP